MGRQREYGSEWFGQLDADAITLSLRLLRRGGEPFLLLPTQPRAAASVLSLYEPQRPVARLAARFARELARLNLLPCGRINLHIPHSLTLFLRDQTPDKRLPPFGILLGNPRAVGRRFLILTCDQAGSPQRVIKAGFTPEAARLILHEAKFPATASKHALGLPENLDLYVSGACTAFTSKFIVGRTPRPAEDTALPALLTSWLDPTRELTITTSASWLALKNAAANPHLVARVERPLAGRSVHPSLYHGDFTPWNVKVDPNGRWTVLDWERGERDGLPLWDWLHFVVQREILVRRQDTTALVTMVDSLLNSPQVTDYTQRADCTDIKRELTLAYLLHLTEVIRPTEGLAENQALLAELAARWLKS
jgi:hypothetical protein